MNLPRWPFFLFLLIGMFCACIRVLSANRASASSLPTGDKAARTPAEQKIDSNLLQALKQQGATIAPQGSGEVRPSPVASAGVAVVDIDAEVTERVLARIHALGGSVISAFPQYHAIRAEMPLARVLELASMREVNFIKPAERPMTNQIPPR